MLQIYCSYNLYRILTCYMFAGSNEDDKLQIGNRCHGRYFGLYQHSFRNKEHLIALDNLLVGIGPQIFTNDTT